MSGRVNESGAAGGSSGFDSETAAPTWEDGLIADNGRHGAVCFGVAATVRLRVGRPA
jgi:hypothetical protein